MSIGTNIFSLRKAKKLTQKQLAEKLGVSEQAVSKWENDICAPDVSLFPAIATFFGVSIDRLFGYHINSYTGEVQQIIKAADNSSNIYDSIKIIEDGLSRYPNSPDLKSHLAHSLFMLYLISATDKGQHSEAAQRAIVLCYEVVDSCDDTIQVDNALNILRNIYCELGDYQSALNAIEKLSPENYLSKILGKAQVLAFKKDCTEHARLTERSLLELYLVMNQLFQLRHRALMDAGEYEKSLAWCSAHEKLASIFDDGCPGFFLPNKTWNLIGKARAYQKLSDKENCLKQVKRITELLENIDPDAIAEDHQISLRNPLYFSSLAGTGLIEEYITAFPLEYIFSSFDEFFGDYEEYLQLKESLTE